MLGPHSACCKNDCKLVEKLLWMPDSEMIGTDGSIFVGEFVDIAPGLVKSILSAQIQTHDCYPFKILVMS